MKLTRQVGILILTLISIQFANANNSDQTVAHLGECSREELTRGYSTGARWYNGGHAGPELREICFKPKVRRLQNGNIQTTSQTFITSGIASNARPYPNILAVKQMWEKAQALCRTKPYLVSKVFIIDVGTLATTRAYFQCTDN